MRILLFVPTYNCEKQISRVLDKLSNFRSFKFAEILCIDNRSQDATLKALSSHPARSQLNFRVVMNSKNLGLGGTHKVAFQYAIDHQFDGCVILHGDDQADIDDFKTQNMNLDIFNFGSRFDEGSKRVNYSFLRTQGNRFFNFFSGFLCRRKITDFGGSGLNYFPVPLLKRHSFWDYPDDLTFHPYLLLNAYLLNQSVHFFPILWREEDQVSNVRMIQQTKRLFKILYKFAFRKKLTDSSRLVSDKNKVSWTDC